MQQRYVILCCVAGVMTLFLAQAENTVTTATTSGALGWIEGKSHENVYMENGDKLSQRDWKIKQTPIVTMAVNWDMSPYITLIAALLNNSESCCFSMQFLVENACHIRCTVLS